MRLSNAIFLLFALNQIATATITFKRAVNYPVGTAPSAVAVADFNGDGKSDLAVANSGNAAVGDDGGISILLGNGDGTFQAAKNLSAGKNPGSIAAADFNGDGKIDLVVLNSDGGTAHVGILLGIGDGTFQSVVEYAAGTGTKGLAVADFNGDQKPDIVLPGFGGVGSIWLGNGDGTFAVQPDFTIGTQGEIGEIVAADFNGDAKSDLAVNVANFPASIAILIGNGDGTFQQSVLYDKPTVWGPAGFVVGDFNNDGKPDLIVNVLVSVPLVSPAQYKLDLLNGNGDGTFELVPDVVPSLSTGGEVSAADFDGDGKLDTALYYADTAELLVLPGNGDGAFQAVVAFTELPKGLPSVIDVNGDKAPDLILLDQTNNSVAVMLNVGTDFSISAAAASPSTVGPGQNATSTISLNLLTRFENPVSLSCSLQTTQAGAPTCSINPVSVTFDGNGKATAQLTITAGASAAWLPQPFSHKDSPPCHLAWLPIAAVAFAGVGLVRKNSDRRMLVGFLAATFLFVSLILQTACGSGGGPRSQTYTVKVAASAGSTQHSTEVTLTVQ